MSRMTIGRKKIVGLTATAAVALTMVSSGAANATVDEDRYGGRSVTTAQLKGEVSTRAFRAEQTEIPSVCTYQSYAPTKVVLGASTVKTKFSVKVTDCTLDQWFVGIYPFMTDTSEGMASNAGPTIPLNPREVRNADAGKHAVAAVFAWGVEDPPDTEDVVVAPAGDVDLPFILQRRSTFGSTFNASPEPVKKGKAITIKGKLARINWNGAKNLKYVGYPKAVAQLQFKAAGTSTYKAYKNVTAGTGGKISTTVKANKTGRWRLYFPGISTTAPATSTSDEVKVTS